MKNKQIINFLKFIFRGVFLIIIINMIIKSGFNLEEISVKNNGLEIKICGYKRSIH